MLLCEKLYIIRKYENFKNVNNMDIGVCFRCENCSVLRKILGIV